MLGAHTKLNCWSLAISWISRLGPCAKPSRQPVMPYALLKPSTTSTSSFQAAGGDQDLAVGVMERGVDRGLELASELGDALGDGVGVPPVLDRGDRGGFDRVGHVEVGQADRQIDRILHGLGHVERLADARGV